MKKNHSNDYILLTITGSLLIFGLAVLFSASTVESYNNFKNSSHYITHQLIFGAFIGLVGMYIASRINYHVWIKYLPVFLFVSIGLLVLVKLPGIGFSSGGATRWIHIGPISFQPSELAKLTIVIYLAAWVEKKKGDLHDFYFGILPSLCIIALFAALILSQPDFGTMLVVIFVSAIMLFTAGINLKYFFATGLLALLSLLAFIKFEPYRAKRITTFFNPSLDPLGISYQINQALIAIGAGGWFGYGYGLSRQKYNYLPEAISDSIFAILAEELGFIRVVFVIILFLLFALRGIQISKYAPDTFGKMLAIGITSWITIQAAINIAAITNLIPLTGIPLPFFSYGSTSLIMVLTSIGILLNISKQSNLKGSL